MNTTKGRNREPVEAVVLQLAIRQAPLRVAFYAWAKANGVTLANLAPELGVAHPSTISTALSGPPGGSERLRRRIESLIGYHPRGRDEAGAGS